MSKNCNYVYVQGLRFRPQDVTVLWKDVEGVEHHVQLRKTGTGFAQFTETGIPLSVTPKDLKKMLRKGETINVIVRAMSESSTEYEKVMLRLDPRHAEGRKGRKAFDAESLAGLPPRGRRALALEQLKTAPYGAENRDQAVERILWGLENLDDAAIAQMLAEAEVGYTSRSSTNEELAALLLSDNALVEALMRDGKHESLRGLLQIAPVAMATLAGMSRPADEVLAEVAGGFLGDGRKPSGDPADYVHAVRYVADPTVLDNLVYNPNAQVRAAAIERYSQVRVTAIERFPATAKLPTVEELAMQVLKKDRNPAVRVAAASVVHDEYTVSRVIRATSRDSDPAAFALAFERLAARPEVRFPWSKHESDGPTIFRSTLYTLLDADRDDGPFARPSDEVLEYLIAGPLLGHDRHASRIAASSLQHPAAKARVAGNTALPDDVRSVAVAGIGDTVERAWFTDSAFPTSVRCAAIVGEDWDHSRSVEEISTPPRSRSPLPLRRVIELARDPDPVVRKYAAWVLRDEGTLREMVAGDSDGDAALVAAVSLLEVGEEDPAVQTGLLEALATSLSGRTFDEQVRERLVAVAEESARVLEKTDHVALASVARTAQAPEVRREAVKAMTRSIDTALYHEVLVEAVTKDADAAVRKIAASGIQDQKVLSDLLETSTDGHTRAALVGNLVNVEVLARTAQNDPSPAARKAAVLRISKFASSSAAARDARHAAAKGDSDPEVRKAALSYDIDQSVCVDVARNDKDPEVRSHAVEFIRSRDVLADIATKDPDPQVRADALACYNSI